jgi:hypothetical protein
MSTATQSPPTPAVAPVAKKVRPVLQAIFKSEEECIKEANSRTKGPRRAFKVTEMHGGKPGKVRFVVMHNEGRAGGVAWMDAGHIVEEIGRAPRKAKPLGLDGIMAAINSLPEAEKNAVLAQLKELNKKS